MASADYKLCDMCSNKHFYDADIFYEASDYQKALQKGTVKSICDNCAETYEVVIVTKGG